MLEQCKKQHVLSFRDSLSRLNNNPVENYFGHLKDDILQKLKNLLTSEIASHLYLRIKAKYIEFYLCKYSDHRPKTVKRLNKKKSKKNNKTPIHVWKKYVNKTREKGIYYKSIHDFGNFQLSKTENSVETADFAETFYDTMFSKKDSDANNNDSFEQMEYSEDLNSPECNLTENMNPRKYVTKVEHDVDNRYYYLRFRNYKSGCFANSVVQCLLGLGKSFLETINSLPDDLAVNYAANSKNSSDFWKELRMFITKYTSFSNEVICSWNFRKIVDQISNLLNKYIFFR